MDGRDTEWIVTERRTALEGPVAPPKEEPPGDARAGTPQRQLSMGPWGASQPATPPAPGTLPAVAAATAVRRVPSYNHRAVRVVRYVTTFLEIVLVIRFFLDLLGASPTAPFSLVVYFLSELFVAPFEGVFPRPHTGRFLLDSATGVAFVIYPLVAWAITSYIRIQTTRKNPFHGRSR